MHIIRVLISVFLATIWVPGIVHGLPFNTDMLDNQLSTGQVSRGRDLRTVPVASTFSRLGTDRNVALMLENPVKPDIHSLSWGKRIFDIQCTTCHGYYDDKGTRTPSPTSQLVPGAPDLSQTEIAAKPDGHFFQYIHFGGLVIMPVYGYKLSETEHWDVVNYVRAIQRAGKR